MWKSPTAEEVWQEGAMSTLSHGAVSARERERERDIVLVSLEADGEDEKIC